MMEIRVVCTPHIYVFNVFIYFLTLCSMTLSSQVDEMSINFPKTWNLQDLVIAPGQAFILKLPSEEKDYLVSESDLDFLPEWLVFDSTNGQFLGIPRKEHLGRNYIFHVEVAGHPSKSDFFRVEIQDHPENDKSVDGDEEMVAKDLEDHHQDHHLRHRHQHSTIRCKKSKSRTIASVILDVSFDDPNFSVRKRINVLESFSGFYEIPLVALGLVGSSEIGDGTLFDNSALVAGPGDATLDLGKREGSNEDSRAIVRWTVGCGSVQKKQMSVLQRVEKEAANGTLHQALGHGLVGWYVTNQKPKDRHRRFLKSGIFPTPTPTISAIPPTALTSYPPPKIINSDREEEMNFETNITPIPALTPVAPITFATNIVEEVPVSKTTKTKQRNSKTKKTTSSTQERSTSSSLMKFIGIKSFNLFEVQVGEVFMLEVTLDFFTIPPTKLEILTIGGDLLKEDSWIKISQTEYRPLVYGVPLPNHEGLQDYVLQGTDATGGSASIALKFKVFRVSEPPLFEVNMVFKDINYDRFMRNVDLRMNLARSIASSFDNRPASDVLITRLEMGSLDYWWTNLTLSKFKTCPVHDFRKIQDHVIVHSNLSVSSSFLDSVDRYGLSYAEFHAGGLCQQKGLFGARANFIKGIRVTPRTRVVLNATSLPMVIYRYSEDGGGEMEHGDENVDPVENPAVESSQEVELLKQIVIPILIVIALVLLSIIVACLVCRRKDKKQQKSSDSTELVSKGAPVIFAHELNDAPPSLSPRPLVPSGGGRSPRPPNYHRRVPQGGSIGYNDFYASEGLMAGQPRYVAS